MANDGATYSAEGAAGKTVSLRSRLLWGTLTGIAIALVVMGLALTAMFRNHVISQFQSALERQLDQLLVELEFDDAGAPHVEAGMMFDPRLQKPYSGLYWQLDELEPGKDAEVGVLRSRSLWDSTLQVPGAAAKHHGQIEISQGMGPSGESLLILQRIITTADAPGKTFRVMVAGDLRFNLEATRHFASMLSLALGMLFVLLGLAAWAQVSIGLRPLRELQTALKAVRQGQATRLPGSFPHEVQPLVDDFNQVLEVNENMLQRARTQAGNLAHALKTPLAVLENETERAARQSESVSVSLLREQLDDLRRHVNWHLMRARAAAGKGVRAHNTDVAAVLAGLLRVLERVFVDKSINYHVSVAKSLPGFAGEVQDLQEIFGNLLENACKWTRSRIEISAEAQAQMLRICIADDGPGIDPAHLESVTERGVRLDESTPGSGLGLAIVQELVSLYEGRFEIENGINGGLRVSVWLPAVFPG